MITGERAVLSTTSIHKLPVIGLYADTNSWKVCPVLVPNISSKVIVKTIHRQAMA